MEIPDALETARAAGIVRWDIKPANILTTDRGALQEQKFRHRKESFTPDMSPPCRRGTDIPCCSSRKMAPGPN
jgi:hypothetical protein